MFLQAEKDASEKEKQLTEALERMRQYEAVSLNWVLPLKLYFQIDEILNISQNLSSFNVYVGRVWAGRSSS